MTKKQQKGKPDIILKEYWNDAEKFADLFNALLFEGKEVIKPEELEERDTQAGTDGVSLSGTRDHLKLVLSKHAASLGVELVLLGLESQTYIDYAAPVRIMGYDYSAYKKQYDENARRYRKHTDTAMQYCKLLKLLTSDEYLSGMRKEDRFTPVITAVLYYGEKPWDASVSLHGILNISPELKEYVNDYKILLIEARNNKLSFKNPANRDFFHLLQILYDRNISKKEAVEKAAAYSKEHKTEKAVVLALAGVTKADIRYEKIEEEESMCSLFEEIAAESRAEGKLEGKAEGLLEGQLKATIDMCIEFQIETKDILRRLEEKLNITSADAQKYLEEYTKGSSQK